MQYFYTDDDDDDATNGDEPIVEAGDYNLTDEIGERIGKDDSSDNAAL